MNADARKEIENPLLGHHPHVVVELPLFYHSVQLKRLPYGLDDREDARCSAKYALYNASQFNPNQCVGLNNTE